MSVKLLFPARFVNTSEDAVHMTTVATSFYINSLWLATNITVHCFFVFLLTYSTTDIFYNTLCQMQQCISETHTLKLSSTQLTHELTQRLNLLKFKG